jgi:hypothetical protein
LTIAGDLGGRTWTGANSLAGRRAFGFGLACPHDPTGLASRLREG